MSDASAPSTSIRRVDPIAAAVAFVLLLAAAAWCALWIDVFAAGASTAQARALQIGFEFTLTTPALAAAWLGGRRWMTATYAVTLAVLVALAFVPWHPRKRFVRDLHSVENGMTVDEVEDVMGRYAKGAGKKWAVPDGPAPAVLAPGETPSPETEDAVRRAQDAYTEPAYPAGDERAHTTGTMTYRWNDTDASYDSDWGQVTFADGRVVEVRFLPD